MKLPPNDCQDCFKGIRDKESFFGELLGYDVFDLHPIPELDGWQGLNWEGTSVDWDFPNADVLKKLLTRPHRKKEGVQFKVGALRIPRSEIDGFMSRVKPNDLAYEWREENGNDCHGHLLFSSAMSTRDKTTIRGLLANCETCKREINQFV